MDKKTTEEALQKTGKGLKGVVGEFKEFISKGNVLDMAVGLIVGSAFTAIVNSLVDDILMPVIGTVLVGINFSSLGITIPWGNHPFIAIGSFLNTIITFLLTALCVFLIVKTMNMFRRKQEEKPAPPKPSKEEQLLTEIRDLLAAQQGKPIQKDEKKRHLLTILHIEKTLFHVQERRFFVRIILCTVVMKSVFFLSILVLVLGLPFSILRLTFF